MIKCGFNKTAALIKTKNLRNFAMSLFQRLQLTIGRKPEICGKSGTIELSLHGTKRRPKITSHNGRTSSRSRSPVYFQRVITQSHLFRPISPERVKLQTSNQCQIVPFHELIKKFSAVHGVKFDIFGVVG